jgi:hypothetical protein
MLGRSPKNIKPIATINHLIEVTPSDELQYWEDANTDWYFIDDPTPFTFRVEGELRDNNIFYGLFGPVVTGPSRYNDLTVSITLRYDQSDWFTSSSCGAGFSVAPTILRKALDYLPEDNSNIPFYLHPEGTIIEGFPRMSRFAEIRSTQ